MSVSQDVREDRLRILASFEREEMDVFSEFEQEILLDYRIHQWLDLVWGALNLCKGVRYVGKCLCV